MDDTIQLFILCAHGLEGIVEDEVRQAPGLHPTGLAYRTVKGHCPRDSLHQLAGLRTADDAFLLLDRQDGISRVRSALNALSEWAGSLRMELAADRVTTLRPLPGRPRFSVSASFVGRRNYTNAEVEAAVARAIARPCGWEWEPNDGLADLLVRVFIVHERAWIGLRLTRRPLHRRSYKVHHQPGSLRPPVAAAMCRLARVARGSRLVDPCCGAGTIVAEAAALGARAIGGDVAFEALVSAAGNLRTMSPRPSLVCWDACRLPLTSGWADAAVSNPPWDVQVIAAGGVNWLQRELLAQLRRAVRPGGRAVLLVEAPNVVRNPGWTLERSIMVSLAGRRPNILVLGAIDEVT